jgi:phosphatidylglycerol:prolipoprotein diacylglycerol transferase
MNDAILPATWGLHPTLFHLGAFGVPSYEFFMLLAIAVGGLFYFHAANRRPGLDEKSYVLITAAIVGGAIGAKIPNWIMHYKAIAASSDPLAWLSGRTIVGGLIGGVIAVTFVRKRLGIEIKTGNLFAPALAIGIVIGRVGCLLRGCCYGKPTSLVWGLDFGDHILRHPTQIYESLFALCLFGYLFLKSKQNPPAGALFRTFVLSYFGFRFFIEFLRTDPPTALGLTLAQLVSVTVVAYYLVVDRSQSKKEVTNEA